MSTQSEIDSALREVHQTKSACENALAGKEWREASHWAYELKIAAGNLEQAIDRHAPEATARVR